MTSSFLDRCLPVRSRSLWLPRTAEFREIPLQVRLTLGDVRVRPEEESRLFESREILQEIQRGLRIVSRPHHVPDAQLIRLEFLLLTIAADRDVIEQGHGIEGELSDFLPRTAGAPGHQRRTRRDERREDVLLMARLVALDQVLRDGVRQFVREDKRQFILATAATREVVEHSRRDIDASIGECGRIRIPITIEEGLIGEPPSFGDTAQPINDALHVESPEWLAWRDGAPPPAPETAWPVRR